MALLTSKSSITSTDFLLSDTDVDADKNGTGVAGDAKDDVFAGSATIHSIFLDAPSGTSYLKLYDNTNPTIGSTAPDIILMVKEPNMWTIVDGIAVTNLSYGATNAGGTAGNTTPAVTVKLFMVVR
tara:strand:+ start:1627 stop:2004 length:378 start_codon:yes stop_codon:yes gene_type:complete